MPYYNYVENAESVTNHWGLTGAAETGLFILNMIVSIESNKKIKKKVIHTLVIFEKNLCRHYIKMKNIGDSYRFLKKDIKDKLPYILIDFSFPIKEKLLSWLVLHPKLFYVMSVLYKKLTPPIQKENKIL
jgi:hypothetical protein